MRFRTMDCRRRLALLNTLSYPKSEAEALPTTKPTKYIWWPPTAWLLSTVDWLLKETNKWSSCVKLKALPTNVGRPNNCTRPLIFTAGGQKVQHLASFSTSLNFEPPRLKMQQDARTLKQIPCVGMIVQCPRQVWWSWVHAFTHPWEPFISRAPPLKLHVENVLNDK